VLIGAALGLLGGGGSVLTVPIFVYVLGFSPKEAIAMSLAVVAATARSAKWAIGARVTSTFVSPLYPAASQCSVRCPEFDWRVSYPGRRKWSSSER